MSFFYSRLKTIFLETNHLKHKLIWREESLSKNLVLLLGWEL